MIETISLEGIWDVLLTDGTTGKISLPGTLDESHIGHADQGKDNPISTRFTRRYTYEGEARLSRRISLTPPVGKRVFLEAERARVLRLFVDGIEVLPYQPSSISTPHVFEVTNLLHGDNELTLLSDNSYPGLPRNSIVDSSAATDETQTNWNGILGYFRLRIEDPSYIQAVKVYPALNSLTIKVLVDSSVPTKGTLTVDSSALAETAHLRGICTMSITAPAGITAYCFTDLPLSNQVKYWEEEEGNLYKLVTSLTTASTENSYETSFGIRVFSHNEEGHLTLNGRPFFIRGEANCAEFPETGYAPMSVEEWKDILRKYGSYGVNCMRFHSHCAPEAAFYAADEMGMLMQPELSNWNHEDAFEADESFAYYQTELEQIILTLANHPSFVMLTLGNELQAGDLGHQRMGKLLDLAHSLDSTRLYANGSNVHYGMEGCDENSDFYASQSFYEHSLRGTSADMTGYMNHQYPNAKTNYDASMAKLRETYSKPVFTFEVGQYEVLPDFDEIKYFHGISIPDNYSLIQQKVEAAGLTSVWKQYVEATGELSFIGYREEIEAALRTESYSGISLLGLQDFPGQGTALVGMMNSHLQPKPYSFAKPERFHAFFRSELPLVQLEKYTYEAGELLEAEVLVANYGKTAILDTLTYSLHTDTNHSVSAPESFNVIASGTLPQVCCPVGKLSTIGTLKVNLPVVTQAFRLNLTVSIGATKNTYPLWLYPVATPLCPKAIYETKHFDEAAKEVLALGGTVYLSPDSTKEQLPSSIQAQFTTDFWSVGTFPTQEGGMGQLIDNSHPLFKEFPSETHTNWQWWPMATSRAFILPKKLDSIITEMDCYAYLRPMAQLLEGRCGNGRILISSMGLQNLKQYPEVRALLTAIYHYLDSEDFVPKQELTYDLVASLVK